MNKQPHHYNNLDLSVLRQEPPPQSTCYHTQRERAFAAFGVRPGALGVDTCCTRNLFPRKLLPHGAHVQPLLKPVEFDTWFCGDVYG